MRALRVELAKPLEERSDYWLLREITRALRRGREPYYLEMLGREARRRLVGEARRQRGHTLRPVRRCCPRSARCRGIFVDVRRYLRALDGRGFPTDGLESHFGVDFTHGRIRVSLANHGTQLHLGLYPVGHARVADALMAQWRREARRLAPITKWWVGSSGSVGLSLVLGRPCPQSLATAIANYHALEDVFTHTPVIKARYDRFEVWLKERLREVR